MSYPKERELLPPPHCTRHSIYTEKCDMCDRRVIDEMGLMNQGNQHSSIEFIMAENIKHANSDYMTIQQEDKDYGYPYKPLLKLAERILNDHGGIVIMDHAPYAVKYEFANIFADIKYRDHCNRLGGFNHNTTKYEIKVGDSMIPYYGPNEHLSKLIKIDQMLKELRLSGCLCSDDALCNLLFPMNTSN